MATGWENLVKAHNLELHVIECGWPFQGLATGKYKTTQEAFDSVEGTICIADLAIEGEPASLDEFDYLMIGPPEGWRDTYQDKARWTYPLTPNGGYHGLLLAHLAVATLTTRD